METTTLGTTEERVLKRARPHKHRQRKSVNVETCATEVGVVQGQSAATPKWLSSCSPTEIPVAHPLAEVAELAGVLVQKIKFVWASVPCETLSRLGPSNRRHMHTHC